MGFSLRDLALASGNFGLGVIRSIYIAIAA